MNLQGIIQRLYDNLEFNPNLDEYRDSVVRRVVDVYDVTNSDHEWLFLQREADLNLFATLEGSATATITIATGAGNRRLVTGTGTGFNSTHEGQTIIIGGVEYTIGRFVAGQLLYLTEPYNGGAVTNSSDWSAEFRRYALPEDCAELLGTVDRETDRGRLIKVGRRTEEGAYLDKDSTGNAEVVIEDDHIVDRPPERAPTLVASTAAGNLEASTEYEYCYVFDYEGRKSPPSPSATVTTSSAGVVHQVLVSRMEDSRWDDGVTPNLATGRFKELYRRDVTNGGPWYLVATNITSGTTTATDASLKPLVGSAGDYHSAYGLLEQEPRKYVRVWYTADSADTLRIRYLMRPPKLAGDSDVPVWPVAYHPYLVNRVMADIWLQHGNERQALIWEARANDLMKRMRKRCLSTTDTQVRFKKFGLPIRRGYNYGTPSIT